MLTGALLLQASAVPEPGTAAYYEGLRVTEVMYKASKVTSLEKSLKLSTRDFSYVELLNQASWPVDLSWLAWSGSPLGLNSTLGTNQSGVLVRAEGYQFRYFTGEVLGTIPELNDNDGTIKIVTTYGVGAELIVFRYSSESNSTSGMWPPAANGNGYSLVQANDSGYLTHPINADAWKASLCVGGSPGVPEPTAREGCPKRPSTACFPHPAGSTAVVVTCSNGGKCTSKFDSSLRLDEEVCKCVEPWGGNTCQRDDSDSPASWIRRHREITIGIGIGLILGLACLLVCWQINRMKAKRKARVTAAPANMTPQTAGSINQPGGAPGRPSLRQSLRNNMPRVATDLGESLLGTDEPDDLVRMEAVSEKKHCKVCQSNDHDDEECPF